MFCISVMVSLLEKIPKGNGGFYICLSLKSAQLSGINAMIKHKFLG